MTTASPRCIHSLFERQVRLTPNATAVIHKDRRLTYAELDDGANRLAHVLLDYDVSPGTLVGLCLSRSDRQMVAILAVLKAGGAYVPLDSSYPPSRLQSMIEDAQPRVLLTERGHWPMDVPPGVQRMDLDSLSSHPGKPRCAPHVDVQPADLVYVIYTSGSTGQPKGVAMPHGPLVNLIEWQLDQFGPQPIGPEAPARTLQFAPISFDVSLQEMFSTWCAGGTLVVVEEPTRRDPADLLRYIDEQQIETCFLPVVALRYLAEAAVRTDRFPETLRRVITAGEQLRIDTAIAEFFRRRPNCRLTNHYGPSETHVVTSYDVPPTSIVPSALPPIGRPIANTQVHIFDSVGDPVPDGEEGELYIGGAPLARGYWKKPDLTRDRFVVDPMKSGKSERCYKTGDMARRRPDGNIEFLGRNDDQIKIHGFRVELAEISAVLEGHPAVRQTVVQRETDRRGQPRLAAYVIPQDSRFVDREQLHRWLREQLPEYMIPARVVVLEELPLSPNGKVDRQQLAAISIDALSAGNGAVLPRNATELQLARIWEELLDREPIGISDDFFELGGDSLGVIELVDALAAQTGVRLPVSRVFEARTIEKMALALHGLPQSGPTSPLVALQPLGDGLPLYLVHPAGGNALCYLRLAQCLGNQQPVYALQATNFGTDEQRSLSVEDMAAEYVDAIRQVQPHGSYALAGWSFGGIVAYEMARQIRKAKQSIRFVGVIDAGIRYSFDIMRRIFRGDGRTFMDMIRIPDAEQIGRFQERTGQAQLVPPGASLELATSVYRILIANSRALINYQPQTYAGKISLLVAQDALPGVRHDPYAEWTQVCPNVERVPISGDHLTLVHEPHAQELADAILNRLTPVPALVLPTPDYAGLPVAG